jgi:hypothetical protein
MGSPGDHGGLRCVRDRKRQTAGMMENRADRAVAGQARNGDGRNHFNESGRRIGRKNKGKKDFFYLTLNP